MDKLLIVVPACNEEDCIELVIRDIHKHLPSYDLVVIDDASTDSTPEIIRRMWEPLVSHPINIGAGGAIETGLKYALKNGYKKALVIDGDGQHDPSEAYKLINAMEKNTADVVIGSRFVEANNYSTPFARKTGILLFSFITLLISGTKIADVTSGFRLYNLNAMRFLINEYPADFPDAETIILLLLSGFKLVEVPVILRQRLSGQSMYTISRSIYYPFKVIVAIIAVILRKLLIKRGGEHVN